MDQPDITKKESDKMDKSLNCWASDDPSWYNTA